MNSGSGRWLNVSNQQKVAEAGGVLGTTIRHQDSTCWHWNPCRGLELDPVKAATMWDICTQQNIKRMTLRTSIILKRGKKEGENMSAVDPPLFCSGMYDVVVSRV